MGCGTRNARRDRMSRSLKTVARKMAKYRYDVGGPRVPLSGLGIVLLFLANGIQIINGGSIRCTPVLSAVTSVELGSDKISWGHRCDVTVLKDNSKDSRGSLCQEIRVAVSSVTACTPVRRHKDTRRVSDSI